MMVIKSEGLGKDFHESVETFKDIINIYSLDITDKENGHEEVLEDIRSQKPKVILLDTTNGNKELVERIREEFGDDIRIGGRVNSTNPTDYLNAIVSGVNRVFDGYLTRRKVVENVAYLLR